MDKAKRKLLEQTYQTILKVGFELNDYELVADLISPNFIGFGTAADEKIFGSKDLKALLKRQKEQSQGIDLNLELNSLYTHLSEDENIAIYIDEVVLSIKTDDAKMEMTLRLSMVLEYIEDKWLMVHFHSSKPEHVESEKDTWGLETWKERAEELEKEVAQRTADLVLKNRDLAVEAALERVRASGMAMQRSDELKDVVREIFDQMGQININAEHAGIVVDYEPKKDWHFWVAETRDIPAKISVPYLNSAWDRQFTKTKKNGDLLFTTLLNFEEKNKFYEELLPFIEGLTQEMKDHYFKRDGLAISTAIQKDIGLYIENFSGTPYTDEENSILLRFAKVFQQTYTRFLDLKKAEEQIREAQIEASLERVRSRAMAIRESQELDEVIQIIFHELDQLGINLTECSIVAYDSNPKDLIFWSAGPIGAAQPSSTKLQYIDHPLLEDLFKDFENGVEYRSGEVSGEILKTWWDRVFSETDFRKAQKEFIDAWKKVKSIYYSQFAMTHGFLEFLGEAPLQEEKVQILKRFTNVIDLTYTRYDDVVKAEAQAREAQIQLSLERVRAKSMAMQSSDALHDVIGVVFQQFDILGVQPVNVFLSLFDREKRILTYRASGKSGNRMPAKQTVDIDNVEAWTNLYDKWINDSSDDIEVIFYPKEIVPDILDLLKATFLAMPKKDRMTSKDFPNGGYSTLGYTDFGYLGYDHTRPPTDEEKDILKRICTEFGRVYQRFLDIQKAEARAREAQIEMALERVRSRTMAMQHSDDLQEVSFLLDQQVRDLNINTWGCAFNIYGEKESTEWFGNEAGILPTYTVPRKGIFKEYYEKGKKGESLFIKEFSGDKCIAHYEYMSSLPVIGDVLKNLKKTNNGFPTFQIDHVVYFKYGYLLFITKESVPESHDIFKRFAKVFEQTYTRFLDLQKAEAQALEAHIEAALERVRSRSMAMHNSDEIGEVAKILFEQLNSLGGQLWATGFGFCEENSKEDIFWFVTETDISPNVKIPHTKDPAHKMMYEGWKTKKDFFSISQGGKKLAEHYKYMQTLSDIQPIFQNILDQGMTFPSWQKWHAAYFKYGYLLVITTEEYKDETVFKRFAKVFEQAYTRFLDLKKAEAQAKEAQIETALERVRSASMAMHKTEDISEVVHVLFDQLKQLNVPFLQAWITILSLDKDYIDTWFSPVDGIYKTPQHFTMPRSFFEDTAIKTWKSKAPFYYLSLKSNADIDTFINAVDAITDSNYFSHSRKILNYNKLEIIEARHEYGFLSKSNTETPSEIEANILQRFTKVFEQAYTRYLDIEKAEAQAREAQINLAVERVRAQALAMHRSEEIMGVVARLKDEVMGLDIPDVVAASIFLNEGKNKVRMWDLSSIEKNDEGYQTHIDIVFNLKAKDPNLYVKRVWENQENYFVEIQEGKDFIRIVEFLRENHKLDIADEIEAFMKKVKLKRLYHATKKLNSGKLCIDLMNPPSKEMETILSKIGAAFDLAYKRFEDLKKAEYQAREAQIEAALEKIRSRSLAMHKPEELQEVVALVAEKLQELGVIYDAGGVILCTYFPDNKDVVHWITVDDFSSSGRYFLPYFDNPIFNDAWDSKTKGDAYFSQEFTVEAKNAFFKHAFENSDYSQMPKDYKQYVLKADQHHLSAAWSKNSAIIIPSLTGVVPSDSDADILKRFARVFEQAYIRFLDLEKAEAQAREAQIEVSLERVRSRAMAMHQTDELTDVLCVLFDQFDILGINPVLTHLTLFDEENETFSLRITTTAEIRIVAEQYIDINAVDAWKNSFENWKKSEPNAVNCIDYEPEIIPVVFDLLSEVMTALPKGHRIYPKDFPDGLYTTQGHFKFGYIGFNHSRKATEEEKDIVVRFAKEFGRTYQRFLDIEKAEAQTREAQIEAALEKVRSRSLAMHQTTEMQQVANEVHDQLLNLGLDIDALAMSGVIKNKTDYDVWVGGANSQKPLRIPYNNDTQIQKDFNKAIKERPELFSKTYKGKVMKAYFKHLMATSNSFNPEIEEFMLTCSAFTNTLTFTKNSGMQIIRYNDNPFSDQDNSIVKRFGRVFEQAYIRFLDLQKAEAQAREAQVEMSLEKVRSRTMAMQTSSELPEAANTLFLEVQALGIPAWSAGYCIWNADKSLANCNMSSEGEIQKGFMLPTVGEGYDFQTPLKKGENFHVASLGGKELVKHYEFMKTLPGVGEILSELVNSGLELPTFQIFHICYFKHGYVMFITYEPVPDAHDIFKRFSGVFEQTYTRFLDLERAEAQTREAQIEMALEKVRSRTMAMQKGEELKDVVVLLYKELIKLGVTNFVTCGYVEINEATQRQLTWVTNPGGDSLGLFYLPLTGDTTFDERYAAWKEQQEVFHQTVAGNVRQKHLEYAITTFNSKEAEEMVMSQFPDPTVFYCFNFPQGYLHIVAESLLNKEEETLMARFTRVFEQTYTRFLDLEKAEAQAREAQIEMALEKVRSRTMAMQKSDELQDAAQVLFNEITGLGIPAWSCGYNILSDDKKSAECWMSSEGQYQKPFTLLFEKEASFIEMYDFFKSDNNVLVQELKGEAIKDHYDYMKSLPTLIPIFKDFDASEIPLPEYQINHLCKFNKGYLLFITYEEVPEAYHVFKRFTKVFEQTYTRFLDLKQAEARARESQIQSALERVRSHSMGMQSTADFGEVTTEMFNQLRNFGEDLFATGIVFCDKHDGHVEQWHSIPGGGMLSPMIVPVDLDYIHQYRYDQWKAGKDLFSIEIPSDFIKQHFEDIFKLPSAQITLEDLESRNAPMPETPDWEIDYSASFKNGYILISSLKPLENTDILPRFAQVFEQAYTRFLDLERSEGQAREAKIEAALEKVRSRTLAMQKSDELAETSVVVFKELLALGIEPNRLFIGIVKDNGDAIDAWATNEDGSKIEQHFKLHTSKNKSIEKIVKGWKRKKTSIIIDMKGKELKEYFHYLNNVMQIPFIDGLKQKRRVQTIAYFSGGLIGMAAPAEQPEETIHLLERFAAVFNLTYTRFNDLKIAEAQAAQAELDLINLQKAKKNAEAALSELQSTQKQLIQSEKMASLGELTAGIAHEIQNPLNFVNNFSEVSKELIDEMLEELENGDYEEVKAIMDDVVQNLEKINHHGKRADSIVKGMLQHSRASGDKKEPTDINALADEYLRLAYHGLRAKDKSFNANLETDFDNSIGTINIIPQDIGRVILNLLTNGFYATQEKQKKASSKYAPTIGLRTKKLKDSITIEVSDNGNGIPEHIIEKVFQPFFTTKPTGEGTGLGLSMSYDIITKGHGGDISVQTGQNEGTSFIIKLPTT